MPDVIRHPEGGGAGIQSDERVRQTSTKAMEMSDYARLIRPTGLFGADCAVRGQRASRQVPLMPDSA